MENIHDWINSGILAILAILFFSQKSILDYMKTAMQTIDPEKIKKAQDYINESKEHEVRVKVSSKIKDLTLEIGKRYQEKEKTFYEQHNELLSMVFNSLREKDWETREKFLAYHPKTAETMRVLLEAYDKGEFPDPEEKES